MESNTNIFVLSKQDTSILKGIAIIAMLMHHLWGCPPAGIEPYTGVLGFLGGLGKVCVAIFLFCSGYGLSVGYEKVSGFKDTLKFLAKRFIKFYAGYWPIFLIFVPLGVFAFHRPLSAAYGEHVNFIKRLILDFMGVQGFQSYNITWWFNQLIILLYLIFPILFFVTKKIKWVALVLGLILMRFAHHMPDVINFADLCTWQFPFLVGIFWAQSADKYQKLNFWLSAHRYMLILVSIFVLILSIVLRECSIIPHWGGIKMDSFITIGLVLCLVSGVNRIKYISQPLTFLGKHSMNMYLTHTFFFSYWFSPFFYSCELRGGANIIALLAICIVVSVIIEWMKEKTKWNELFIDVIMKRIQ